jgi:hypothetical protein
LGTAHGVKGRPEIGEPTILAGANSASKLAHCYE